MTTVIIQKRKFMITLLCVVGVFVYIFPALGIADQVSPTTQRGLEAMYKNADYDKAIACFTKSIKEEPENRFLNYGFRGVAHKKKGEYEKAILDFTEAIRINPAAFEPYISRADAYYNKHDYRKALNDYDIGIRLNPNRSISYYNRGLTRDNMKEYDKAIADYSIAIRLNDKYVNAYIARGSSYRKMGDYEKAITDYTKALQFNSDCFIALHNRGLAYSDLGCHDMAIKDYYQAIKSESENPLGYHRLAWELATCPKDSLRNGKKAVEYAKKACQLSRWRTPLFYAGLAAAYAECGNFEQAVEWQSKALKNSEYAKQCGDQATHQLSLYKNGKPYRNVSAYKGNDKNTDP